MPPGHYTLEVDSPSGDGSLELDLAAEHLPFPLLVLGLAPVELGHDLFRKQLQAFADVGVRVATGLIEQNDAVDFRGLEFAQLVPDRLGRADEAPAQRRGVSAQTR